MLNEEIIDVHNRTEGLPCPHCQAGRDQGKLGLIWDCSEEAWRCLLCGHRSFLQKKRSETEIAEERLWDQILTSLYPEGSDNSNEEAIEKDDQIHFSGRKFKDLL
jgi:hypothetical protein